MELEFDLGVGHLLVVKRGVIFRIVISSNDIRQAIVADVRYIKGIQSIILCSRENLKTGLLLKNIIPVV